MRPHPVPLPRGGTAAVQRQRGRRAVIAALLLGVAAPAVLAQDPRASIVQQAARDWLAINDRGDYDASWRAAGERFRNSVDVDRWRAAAEQERTPRGAAKERTIAHTTFMHKLAGAPDGDYALVNFRTAFENRPNGGEQVTLEREPDGTWRVIGYVIV